MKQLFISLFLCLSFACTIPTSQSSKEQFNCAVIASEQGTENSVPTVNGGERKAIAILVNFQDVPMQPYTPDRAREVIFTNNNNFIRENSYGMASLTGDVYGWYTIPVNSTVCDTLGISTYALQAAVADGANLALYNQYIFLFPQMQACPFSGGSTIGGTPAKAWINSDWLSLGTVAHELMHGLGLYHSHSLDCGDTVLGNNCTVSDYGDSFDILGSMMSVHTNLYQKERAGWVQPQLVTSSGTYHIDPYETLGGVKGLKILKSTDPFTGERIYYYIEKRTSFGYDVLLANYLNPMTGVVVHTASDTNPNKSYLLDMTPATASWWDPALTVGQTYSDLDIGLTITVLEADGTGATVRVDITNTPTPTDTPTPTATATGMFTSTSTFTPTSTSTNTPTAVPTVMVDTQPPLVAITSPPNNSILTGGTTISITASASDNVAVSSVDFYVGGILVSTDASAPYSCNWAVPAKRKKYTIYAVAKDTSNNSQTSAKLIVTTR